MNKKEIINNYEYSINSEHETIIDTYLNNPIFILLEEHNSKNISNYCKHNLIRILKLVKIPNYNIIEYISKIKTIPIINIYYKLDDIIKFTEIFKQFISDLDNELSKYSMEFNGGCTITITYILKNYIITVNLGNSRTILLQKNNNIIVLSEDHTSSNPIEKKRIEKFHCLIKNNKINNNIPVSRSLGNFKYKNKKCLNSKNQIILNIPDFKYYKKNNYEKYILIGSHNLWNVFTNNKLIYFIEYINSKNINDIHEISTLIKMKAKKIGYNGSLTIIIINLNII